MKQVWIALYMLCATGLVQGVEPGEPTTAQVAPARSGIKDTKASTARGETLCIGTCDARDFSIKGHKSVQANLWETTARGPVCSDALNDGLYAQDIGEFYKAEAHFDNCAFEESLEYLQTLKASAESLMQSARETYKQDRDQTKLQNNVLKAMREFGRALHIVQDFYAHTNYIDLMAADWAADSSPALRTLRQRSAKFSEALALQIWTTDGAAVVRGLQSNAGLVSGTVSYETSRLNRCPAGSPTHGQLAKDAAIKGNGAVATRWSGVSKYQAATTLATASTRDFILDVSKAWPQVEAICGRFIRVLQINEDIVQPH